MNKKAKANSKKSKINKSLPSKAGQSNLSNSKDSSVDQILNLQKTAGNQAVKGLFDAGKIQPKLTIGQPGDKYELEADRMAEQVMRMPDSACPSCVEEGMIQRQPVDEEERKKEEELVQTKPISDQTTPLVRRQVEDTEKKKREEEMFQAKEDSGGLDATADIDSGIDNIKGKGEPLPESTRNYFEPRFGADFGEVRIHTGSEAAKTAESINSRAFTVGNDVVFGSHNYSPETKGGKKLLAHELTHVVQQKGANKSKARSNNKLLSAKRRVQRQTQTATDYKWLEDTTVQGPRGWRYRFRLYETTPELVKKTAAMKNCHVLQPGSAAKFSKLYGFDKENYAPLYKPGRFYSLYHLDIGPYLTLETFLENIEKLKEQPLESMIPKDIGLLGISLSFSIPKNTELKENISTTDTTTISISVSSEGIELRFSPGLKIQAPWYASNMSWSGLYYDFAKAQVTKIYLKNTQWWLFSGLSEARAKIKNEFFYPLISLTRIRKPGYSPLTDPNIGITLKALENQWKAMTSTGDKGKKEEEDKSKKIEISNITVSGSIWNRKKIEVATEEGGILIPPGTMLSLSLALSGGLEEVTEKSTRKISSISIGSYGEIEGKGIFVLKGKSPVAKLDDVTIQYGGKVSVLNFSLAGTTGKVGAGISLLKLLYVLGGGREHIRTLAPVGLRKYVREQVEEALTKAFREFIVAHPDLIPGMDLFNFLGIPRPEKNE